MLWNPQCPQCSRRDLQVVPGVGEWPETLARGWEWTLTLCLTTGSGPCRAEWGVFGHPGTLLDPKITIAMGMWIVRL